MSAVATAAPPPSLPRGYVSPLLAVLAGSALLWAVLFASIGLAQDFPLNDDWAFGRGMLWWADGYGINYSGWASMPQLGQWIWAYGFVKLLGPSFIALRISTIVLSWLGLWAFYDLLRQQGFAAGRAALATAVLAFNPLFVLLQGTFMTDVPALSFALLALALYQRAMQSERWSWLVAAVVAALLGVSTRQNAAVVLLVAGLLLGRKPTLRRRPLWLLSVLIPLAAAVLVHLWFRARPDVRASHYDWPQASVWARLPFSAIVYGGLAVLPLMVLQPRPGSWKCFAVGLAVLLTGLMLWRNFPRDLPYGSLFPYMDNMITPRGAFCGSSYSGELIPGEWTPERPVILGLTSRWLLSCLGCLAGAWLVARAGCAGGRRLLSSPLVLLGLLQIPLLLAVPDIFDRYLLFLFPAALVLALPQGPLPLWRWMPATAQLIGLAVVSTGLMHDWLAWNAARWELGRRLVLATGLDPRDGDIEGGIEWDGLYLPAPRPTMVPLRPRGLTLPFINSKFGYIRGRFALSFAPLAHSHVVAYQPYNLWLAPGPRQFYLLQFDPPAAAQPKSKG